VILSVSLALSILLPCIALAAGYDCGYVIGLVWFDINFNFSSCHFQVFSII
jgi:hypothetical protein